MSKFQKNVTCPLICNWEPYYHSSPVVWDPEPRVISSPEPPASIYSGLLWEHLVQGKVKAVNISSRSLLSTFYAMDAFKYRTLRFQNLLEQVCITLHMDSLHVFSLTNLIMAIYI